MNSATPMSNDPEKELPWTYFIEVNGETVRGWVVENFRPWLRDNYYVTELAPTKNNGYIIKFERAVMPKAKA